MKRPAPFTFSFRRAPRRQGAMHSVAEHEPPVNSSRSNLSRRRAIFCAAALSVLTILSLQAPTAAADEGDILLSEIVPLLAGSPAGDLVVAEAPPPGSERLVRRSEVLAALREAGLDARGIAIPRVTRIRRDPTILEGEDLQARAMPAIREALAPCEAQSVRLPRRVTLPPGEISIDVDARVPQRTGSASGVAVFSAGTVNRRLPFSARVTCPPPAVSPGSRIRLVVRIGNVTATAPGEANQAGRIGDIIRVRNLSTRRALRARVIDGHNAEVLR